MPFPISAGLLEACVLGVLTEGDTYGYLLTQRLQTSVDLSESALYPVLRRLQKENYLDTYERLCDGRNRRYYKITESGKKRYYNYVSMWVEFRENLDKLIIGDDKDGKN